MTDSDEVKLLPTVDDILRDYESGAMDAAGTIEDLVAIIDATRPPVVTDEVVELVGLTFMAALHEHLPEADKPSARCDFSDEQWLRIEHASRKAIASMPAVVSGGQGDPTQFGDGVAKEMRAYFDAHKNDRWRRGTADNLMLGLFNIAARALRAQPEIGE